MKKLILSIFLISLPIFLCADEIDEVGLLYRAEHAEQVANAWYRAARKAEAEAQQKQEEIDALQLQIEKLQEECKSTRG